MILTCGSFNHALSVLTHFRVGQMSLRTRILILVANGFTEALLQLSLSCLQTVYARVLCIGWSTEQQDCVQPEHDCDVHNNTSRKKFRSDDYRTRMNIDQWFLEISLTVTPAGVLLLCRTERLSTVCSAKWLYRRLLGRESVFQFSIRRPHSRHSTAPNPVLPRKV